VGVRVTQNKRGKRCKRTTMLFHFAEYVIAGFDALKDLLGVALDLDQRPEDV
jgi:hypothetical protein